MLISKIPSEVMIEVTNRCNLACRFCFNKNQKVDLKKEMNTEELKRAIDKIADSPISQVRFTGGEPLLRRDIIPIIKYSVNRGLRAWLNTNATLINEEIAYELGRYVDNVLVSLDSVTEKHEFELTGKKSLSDKIRGIKLLKKAGIKTLRCGTVATKENIKNLEKFFFLVRRLRADDWELFRPIPIVKNEYPINNKEVKLLAENLLRINRKAKKEYKIANAIPFCSYYPEKMFLVSNGAKADDGHNRFVIDSMGNSKPMYFLQKKIGDFSDSIMDCWNNKFMKDMRSLKMLPVVCRGCNYRDICKGGSRYISKIMHNKYNGPDPLAQPEKFKNQLFNRKFKRYIIKRGIYRKMKLREFYATSRF